MDLIFQSYSSQPVDTVNCHLNSHDEEDLFFRSQPEIRFISAFQESELENSTSRIQHPDYHLLTTVNYDTLLQNDSLSDAPNLDDTIPEIEAMNKNSAETRKRRSKPNPQEWQRVKQAKLREQGNDYLGCQYQTVVCKGKDTTRFLQNVSKASRTLGQRCSGHNKNGTHTEFKCDSVTDEERENLFRSFWGNLNWDQRKVLIPNLVKTSEVKRRRTESWDETVEFTNSYYLKPKREAVRVCLQMFSSTYALSKKTIQRWISANPTSDETVKVDDSVSKPTNRGPLIVFFNSLPKLPSHYCRINSTKLYLEPSITSKSHLYTVYKQYCARTGEDAVSVWTFKDEFSNQNLSIHHPKKDQCNDCLQFKSGNLSKELYDKHIISKNKARSEKQRDKTLAQKVQVHLITVDVQAVQQSPVISAGESYFKSKLNLHNYTIYDVSSNDACCYWWTEVDCDLSASAFISCLLQHLDKSFTDMKPIVIFSDGCGSQNRNSTLSNALLNYAVVNKKVVIQKFLVKGHTEMEVDSVHSCIEAKKKRREIHLPSEYVKISQEARTKPRPYSAFLLPRDFFKDYTQLSQYFYKSIRPGKGADLKVVNLRALKYDPDGIIYFKTDFADGWEELPGRLAKRNLIDFATLPTLYTDPRPISVRKFNDLQSLKAYIPHDCHYYYDSLPH